MEIDHLAIDSSVSAVFPPKQLLERLGDVSIETSVLKAGETAVGHRHGVVTLAYRESFLDAAWIHSIQAGIDRFPRDACRDADVTLSNSTGIHGDAIGETVAGYVLAFARHLHRHVANQQRREWSQPAWDEAWTVADEAACVVGLGGLGRGIVDRLTGLGLNVTGVRTTPLPEPGVTEVYTPAELQTAVADARFVALAVPLTDDTRHMIDESVFEAMRDDAYLLNVARGDVVDQAALVAALEDGEIAGAALDVFETEPLPETSPLWEMDDVIVSPHCGAFTREYVEHIAAIVRESLDRIENGSEPVNLVS